MYEDWNTPPEYDDEPEPQELGRSIEHTGTEQLFTHVFSYDEDPNHSSSRNNNGQIDFDILRDKTPQGALWAVRVIDEAIPDTYKMLWYSQEGEVYVQDIESVINFATDQWRENKWAKGIEDWQVKWDYECDLIKLVTPDDVDFVLEDLYDYLKPAHGGHYGKSRKIKPLSSHEISRVKRAITALIIYKKKLANTVGGN